MYEIALSPDFIRIENSKFTSNITSCFAQHLEREHAETKFYNINTGKMKVERVKKERSQAGLEIACVEARNPVHIWKKYVLAGELRIKKLPFTTFENYSREIF